VERGQLKRKNKKRNKKVEQRNLGIWIISLEILYIRLKRGEPPMPLPVEVDRVHLVYLLHKSNNEDFVNKIF
jgi:hypothetical protein